MTTTTATVGHAFDGRHLTVCTNGKWWESRVFVDGEAVDVMGVEVTVNVDQPCTAIVTFDRGVMVAFDDVEVTAP